MAILHHLPMRSFNMTYRKNMQLTTSLLLEIAPSVQTCSFATGKLHTINYLCHFKVMTHFRISDTYSIFRHDIGAVTILGSENCQSISFQNLLSASQAFQGLYRGCKAAAVILPDPHITCHSCYYVQTKHRVTTLRSSQRFLCHF